MATDRSAYIEGLRELARRLEAHPDAPLPYVGSKSPLLVMVHGRDEMAEAARCYGGRKEPDEHSGFRLADGIPGLSLAVLPVSGVCERVEVSRETRVEYDVPDEVAEEYAIEREVPVFEWRCPDSILAPEQLADAVDTEAVAQ